jgi:glycerophosphoryl diester phosphodiesterase
MVLPKISAYDINYYLTNQPPEFISAVLMAIPVAAAMAGTLIWFLSRWVMAMPLILFTDTTVHASFRRSAELTRGNHIRICMTLIFWALITAIVVAVASIGLRAIIAAIIPPITAGLVVVVILALLALVFWSLVNMLVGAISVGVLAVGINTLTDKVLPDLAAVEPHPDGRPQRLGLILLVAATCAAAFTGWGLLQRALPDQTVTVIAHRGAAGVRPENTLSAVNEAIQQGADWIEIDVQETADGEVIVIHDSDLMKISGNPLKIWEATVDDLPEIDVGSWFDPTYSEERVPTLRDVLDVAKGSANVLIELKYYGHDDQLSARVAKIVEETDMVGNTAFMSLKPDQLAEMQATRPTWRSGLLAAVSLGDLSQFPVDFLAVNAATASSGFISRSHDAGKDVYVWTINDPLEMSLMIARGVDGLITDEPAIARAVIAQRAEMTTAQKMLLELAVLFGFDGTNKIYRDASP